MLTLEDYRVVAGGGAAAAGVLVPPLPLDPKSCECSLEVQLLEPSRGHCCDDSEACSLQLVRTRSHNFPCIRGTHFGCHGSAAMYTSRGCRGLFRCNGTPVRCQHFGANSRKASACLCSNASVSVMRSEQEPRTRLSMALGSPKAANLLLHEAKGAREAKGASTTTIGDQLRMASSPNGFCGLIVFKHIEKTAGTSLATWFYRMSSRRAFGGQKKGYEFYSGWTGDSNDLSSCAVVKKRLGQPLICSHIAVQHRYVVAQFARRFCGNATQAAGWKHGLQLPGGLGTHHGASERSSPWRFVPDTLIGRTRRGISDPMATMGEVHGYDDIQRWQQANQQQRRSWRAVLEIHGTDRHLSEVLKTILIARHASPSERPSLHGCTSLVITMIRSPAAYLRSKYLWYLMNGYVPKSTPFETFLAGDSDPQARDLMRGYPRFLSTRLLSKAAMTLLRNGFDIVAPTERFLEFLGLLCAQLSLSACPCGPTKRVGKNDATQRKKHLTADEYKMAANVNATHEKAAVLALQFARVDQELYKWTVTSFNTHLYLNRIGNLTMPAPCTT